MVEVHVLVAFTIGFGVAWLTFVFATALLERWDWAARKRLSVQRDAAKDAVEWMATHHGWRVEWDEEGMPGISKTETGSVDEIPLSPSEKGQASDASDG